LAYEAANDVFPSANAAEAFDIAVDAAVDAVMASLA
jgi:hypothetical protein